MHFTERIFYIAVGNCSSSTRRSGKLPVRYKLLQCKHHHYFMVNKGVQHTSRLLTWKLFWVIVIRRVRVKWLNRAKKNIHCTSQAKSLPESVSFGKQQKWCFLSCLELERTSTEDHRVENIDVQIKGWASPFLFGTGYATGCSFKGIKMPIRNFQVVYSQGDGKSVVG